MIHSWLIIEKIWIETPSDHVLYLFVWQQSHIKVKEDIYQVFGVGVEGIINKVGWKQWKMIECSGIAKLADNDKRTGKTGNRLADWMEMQIEPSKRNSRKITPGNAIRTRHSQIISPEMRAKYIGIEHTIIHMMIMRNSWAGIEEWNRA